MNYTKTALMAFICLSISSTFAMQHIPSALHHVASDMKELLFTPEAKTVLTTAGIIGGCHGLYRLYKGIYNNYNLYKGKKTVRTKKKESGIEEEEPVFVPLTCNDLTAIARTVLFRMVTSGVSIGMVRLVLEHHGSWPQLNSSKPAFLGLLGASVLSCAMSSAETYNNVLADKLNRSFFRMKEWVPYGLLGASLWTAFKRYQSA